MSSQTCNPPLECWICDIAFNTHDALRYHYLNEHDTVLECYWAGCGHKTSDVRNLYDHVAQHQLDAVRGGGRNPTQCQWPGCGEVYKASSSAQYCFQTHNDNAFQSRYINQHGTTGNRGR